MTNPMCSALAFYGASSTSAAEFYNEIMNWYDQKGAPFTRAWTKRFGRSAKVTKKLLAEGFTGVEGIELSTLKNPSRPPGVDNYAQAAMWSQDHHFPTRDVTMCMWHPSNVATLDDPSLLEMVGRIIRKTNPSYGIGYYRAREFGPGFYAVSIVYESSREKPPDREEDHLGAWRLAMNERAYLEGEIRSIYPLNYLNDVQLSRTIEDQTLRAWILADSRRGRLDDTGTLTLWEVPSDSLGAVRRSCDAAGLTFNRARFLARLAARQNQET